MSNPLRQIIVTLLFFLSLDIYAQKVNINNIYYSDEKVIIDSGNASLLKQTKNNTILNSEFEIIKPDFLVNSISGESRANKYRPNIASDGSGNVITCWVDYRNGRKDLYAQFYNSNTKFIGKNILITDIPTDWNLWPSVAANKKGDFIITWAQSSSEIFAQRLYKDGSKVGNNFKVNSQDGWNLNYPSAAIDNDGNFIIIWTYNDRYRYSRLFNNSGTPQSSDILISENKYSNTSSLGEVRQSAVDQQGNFATVWSSYYNNVSEIIFQMIDQYGNKIGNNLIVSDLDKGYNSYFPSISATDSGYYFITWDVDSSWESRENGGRIINKDGSFVTGQLLFGNGNSNFSVASNWKDKFVFCWLGNTYSSSQNIYIQNMYGQIIGNNGSLIGNSQIIDYGKTKNNWLNSFAISNMSANGFYLTFDDYHDVYIQRFDSLFKPLTNEIRVNDDVASSFQYDPEVCYNNNGQSIIIWKDERNGKIDIYGRVFDKSFNPVGNEIMINDVAAGGYFKNRSVKSLSDGNFVVAFSGKDYDSGGLNIQLISNNGEKLGRNKLVQKYGVKNITLGIGNDDEILLCWYNSYSGGVATQRFDKDLTAIGGQRTILKSTDNLVKRRLYLSINNNLNILASWINYNYKTNEYVGNYTAEILDKSGKDISGTFNIKNNINGNVEVRNYLNDDGNCIFYWIQNYNLNIERFYRDENNTILTNKFYANGTFNYPKIIKMENRKLFFTWTSGTEVNGYFINDYNYSNKVFKIYNFGHLDHIWQETYNANDMDIFDDKMIFVYESNKNGGTGYDIWCNVQKMDSLDFNREIKRLAIYEDTMFPIFPNPFNNSTTIAYELKEPHNVKISLFDILGRRIDILLDKFHNAGFYQLSFNAEKLSSGIYFCVFEAKTTSVQKLIVLK